MTPWTSPEATALADQILALRNEIRSLRKEDLRRARRDGIPRHRVVWSDEHRLARLALAAAELRLREQQEPRLVWTIGTESRKNPNKLVHIPTAQVGPTATNARNSCVGCDFLDHGCNAHEGRRIAVVGKIGKGNAGMTLENALAKAKKAKAIRITAIGDVGGGITASRREVVEAITAARGRGLAVLGFTHFWARPENQDLRSELMASVNASYTETELDAADDAVDRRWRPAAVLTAQTIADQVELDPDSGRPVRGSTVVTPKGNKLLVCPYYTRGTRCNDCRLCDPQAKAWATGRYEGVAFIEHKKGTKKVLPVVGPKDIPMPSQPAAAARSAAG